ncbi:MAG: LysM domain-containing protein [Calditrichaeota bacterium]|nr:MAG: LysM domain-containing protein [Calditrichota bacterium]
MKKLFLILLFVPVLFALLDPASQLLSRFLRLEQPTIHEINQGDWLSKIAQKYYGDVSYWKELALINRAPDGNLIFPGEKIIVPSFATIQKIRKARSLSKVNELIAQQQAILAGNYQRPAEPSDDSKIIKVPEHASEEVKENVMPEDKSLDLPAVGNQTTNETSKSSGLPGWLLWAGMVVLVALGFVVYFIKKRKSEEVETFGAGEEDEVQTDGKNIFMEDFKESRSEKKEANLIG